MFEECRLEGTFTLSSGRKSTVFYDFDLLSPREAAEYVQQLIQQIPKEVIRAANFIACPAIGGIVPATFFAFAADKRLVIVDKDGKLRGPEFQAGKYLIIDDVITSFQAANRVRNALPGMEALGVAAYVFRGTWEDLKKQDYPAFYLARKESEEE
jgi:orotate phosphoribosyltransferase